MPKSSATANTPVQAFEFSGQSHLDTWTPTDHLDEHDWSTYKQLLRHEPRLCFERIRELADRFPTYQNDPPNGPQADPRAHPPHRDAAQTIPRRNLRRTPNPTSTSCRTTSPFRTCPARIHRAARTEATASIICSNDSTSPFSTTSPIAKPSSRPTPPGTTAASKPGATPPSPNAPPATEPKPTTPLKSRYCCT
jgi:hypothetical protein